MPEPKSIRAVGIAGTYRRSFAVKGHWPFPLDMLRYDGCLPTNSADADLISRISRDNLPDDLEISTAYTFQLVTTEPQNAWWRPTERRWASYGNWKIDYEGGTPR